jgi:hypothetical protein
LMRWLPRCCVYRLVTGVARREWKSLSRLTKDVEARGGIEPPIRVLQTLALPLGYRAPVNNPIFLLRNLYFCNVIAWRGLRLL